MPASRQHNAKLHHLAEHAIAKDLRANTIKVARALERAEDESDDEGRLRGLAESRASLIATERFRLDLFETPCLQHDAMRGEFCYRNERSRTRGFCAERVQRATKLDRGFQMSASKIGSGR